MEMVRLRDEQGIVMLAALGMVAILAGISLAVASSGQMSTIGGSLSVESVRAFYAADGGVFYALGEAENFDPDIARTTDLSQIPVALDAEVASAFVGYESLPGNLMIRTTDGRLRPAQFGQGAGLGKMFMFQIDSRKVSGQSGLASRSHVRMTAARPGPCMECGG
ncbi:MAG: hypothetical protein P8R45_05575 [Candidatus Binatia bacterium]|jgi:hypothetical protein|nr:hypothetical protein [Candidatus Binatia bacterium]